MPPSCKIKEVHTIENTLKNSIRKKKIITMEINKLNFDKKAATKITLFFVLAFGISYFLNLLSNPLASYGFKVNLNYAFGPFLAAILVG